MRTYITVTNEQASLFEHTLEEFEITEDYVVHIRQRDFMTDFIFEDLNEEELTTLEQLQNDLN